MENDVIKAKTYFVWLDFCKLLVYYLVTLILLKSIEKPFAAIFYLIVCVLSCLKATGAEAWIRVTKTTLLQNKQCEKFFTYLTITLHVIILSHVYRLKYSNNILIQLWFWTQQWQSLCDYSNIYPVIVKKFSKEFSRLARTWTRAIVLQVVR